MNEITKIRNAVATLANNLNRKLNNLSAAFAKAWRTIKGRILLDKVRVAGVTQNNRQKALHHLQKHHKGQIETILTRDANNPYDSNAIKVEVRVNDGKWYHLGFIPAEIASVLTPLMDKGIQLKAYFKAVTGGYGYKDNYGALLEIGMVV